MENQSPDVNAILNPPLGKKPNLSEKQMKNMRMVLQLIQLPSPQNNTYFYNIASKQSNWGFSQNQRLLILNVNQKSISYLSKVPQGYLPFTTFDDIAANKIKQKIVLTEVTNFKCLPLKGKISSMQIQWLDKQKKQKKWIFVLGSSKLMNDWIQVIGSLKDGNYDRKKYQQMNKVNNSSLLTSYTPPKRLGYQNSNNNNLPSFGNPNTLTQKSNQNEEDKNNISTKIQNSQNIPPENYAKIIQNSLLQRQGTSPFKPPFQHINNSQGDISRSNLNQNIRNSVGNRNNLSSNDAMNSKNTVNGVNSENVLKNANLQSSKIGNKSEQQLQNSHLATSTQNNNSNNSNPITNNVYTNTLENSKQGLAGESEFSRRPIIQKIGQSTINNPTLNNSNNLGYNNNTQNNKIIAANNENDLLSKTYGQNSVELGSNIDSSIQNINIANTNSQGKYQPNDYKFGTTTDSAIYKVPSHNNIPQSNTNINVSNNNQLRLNPSTSQAPGDFVQQLKKQKQRNPDKFNLTNELSKKKFQQYNPNTDQQYTKPDYQNNDYRPSNNASTPQQDKFNYGKGSNMSGKQTHNLSRAPLSQNKRLGAIYDSRQSYQPLDQEYKPFSKNKQNPSNISKSNFDLIPIQDSKSLNRGMSKQYSRGQLPNNNIKGGESSGLQNNYDRYQMMDNNDYLEDDVYKPATNFPESTKNLTKIRSDYLQRKANNINNLNLNDSYNNNNNEKHYPQTSKNDDRVLLNNYIDNQTSLKQRNQKNSRGNQSRGNQSKNNGSRVSELKSNDSRTKMHKFNEPSFQKLPKFDSSQKSRQSSIHNLNKQISSLNNQIAKSYPSYNQLWLQTSNPNKKIQIHEQFVARSTQIVKQIIEELPLPESYREYKPIDSFQKQNVYTFVVQNIIITLHFFNQHQSMNGSEDNINQDAPVMYDHATYQELKRQFYNYNLILAVTNNQGRIKVPLCSYIEYRGILAVARADVPTAYKQVEPYPYKHHFQNLQNIIKVRFLFNTFNCYQSQGYRGGEGKFILLWNLKNLIPGIPNNLKHQSSYFRKEFLLQYDQILQDLQSSAQAHAFTLKHILPDLLTKLECLQLQIIHSKDLNRQFHRVGLSLSYLPQMYKHTNSIYLKRIFVSEIVANMFTTIVRSELNHAFSILPVQNLQNISPQQLNNIIVDCCHVLINQFFSYTLRSQSIWKLIVNQSSKRYRIIVSKQDVIPGYLLSALMEKINLVADFKLKSFLKNKKFFVQQDIIPRQIFISFDPTVRRYDMQSIDPTYSKCKQIIELEQPTSQNYQHISTILNLKNNNNGIRQYYKPIVEQLKTYIANYIPYTLEQEYENIDVYQYMYEEPIGYNGIKTAFLAIKWLIKANQIEKANQIFEIKFHQLTYWIGQYNTAITQFYDFFSMFYASIGDFQQSICLAKSSLINVTKILGIDALPIADKHYQLGNIYFKINKKNDALKQYSKTKNILISHNKTTIPEYGIILIKIALLSLNFGDLTECLGNAIQAEKIFQQYGGNQNQQIQCFQILSRAYQITRKLNDMNNLCEACSKTFNHTENPKIMQRMLKIVLFPKLSSLSSAEQKHLLPIIQKLQEHSLSSNSYLQSFTYLHKVSLKPVTIKKKIYNFLQNVGVLSQQINRRDLLRKHISLNEKTSGDAEQMLSVIEAVGNLIGWGFWIGSLKDMLYQ